MSYPNAIEVCRAELFTKEVELRERYPQALVDKVLRVREMYNCMVEKFADGMESMEWYSIKRWAKLHRKNWRNYSWRKLKAVSHELGYEVKKIFDSNFDEVNIYHRVVFEALYGR